MRDIYEFPYNPVSFILDHVFGNKNKDYPFYEHLQTSKSDRILLVKYLVSFNSFCIKNLKVFLKFKKNPFYLTSLVLIG